MLKLSISIEGLSVPPPPPSSNCPGGWALNNGQWTCGNTTIKEKTPINQGLLVGGIDIVGILQTLAKDPCKKNLFSKACANSIKAKY